MENIYCGFKVKKANQVKVKNIGENVSILAIRGSLGSLAISIKQDIIIKKINNFYCFKGHKKNLKKMLIKNMESTTKINKESINLVSRNLKIIDKENDKAVLTLEAGYSNKVHYFFKGNENFIIEQKNKCSFFSLDKKKPKNTVYQLRYLRPPNPYTEKGIYINNEKIKKKQGKKTQY